MWRLVFLKDNLYDVADVLLCIYIIPIFITDYLLKPNFNTHFNAFNYILNLKIQLKESILNKFKS